MGRRKIEIKPILDPKTLLVTFAKRKVGLFNKAYELSVLCKCKVAVLVVTNRDRVHKFASTKFDEILEEANRSKHPPDVTDCRKPLKKHRKRVADQSTPRHSVSGTEDPAENSSPKTPDSSTPLCGRRNSIYQNCLTSPVDNARDNVADRYAPSAPPPSARDVPDSAAPISYVMAIGPKVSLVDIPQSPHFLDSNMTALPVSSNTIPSSSCAPFTPSADAAAAAPCPPAVTPITSGLHSICLHNEFPILTSLPASAPASNQHPMTEISMPLPPPAAARGSLLPIVPSSPPASQQPEMTADSPRFLGTTVTKTEDLTPTPTVTESRQDMEPVNLFETTASAETNQQKDFTQRSRSASSRPLPAITANALEVQNFVRPFESEAPSTFFARTKGILPKMSVRKELRGSEETLKTPVIFTTKADIWPPFQMNIISGMESLVELPSMPTTAGAVNRQAEEEVEKEDNEEEECGREAASSRKRITYPFDERLIGEPGSSSQPKRQLLREEGTT